MDVNHSLYFGTGTFTKPDLHSDILCKAIDINPLILKNASGASRSPVNNCGEVQTGLGQSLPHISSEYATTVMKLVECGHVEWNDPDVAKVLGDAARRQSLVVNHQQKSLNPSKMRELAPSTQLTKGGGR